jgi:hypothetical protein
MIKSKYLILLTLIPNLYAATQNITEGMLVKKALSSSPSIHSLLAKFKKAQFRESDFKQQYRWNLVSEARREQTNEKPLITFAPVFSPSDTLSIGMHKNTQSGLGIKGSVFHNKREFSLSGSETTRNIVGANFGITLDLYKDFLGKTSTAQIKQMSELTRRQKVEKAIAESEIKVSIRRLFWNTVANAEKLRISKQLLQSSNKQLKLAERRKRSGVADAGEVALYYSQVSSREARVSFYEFKQINLFKSVKQFIPSLAQENLVVADYDMEKAVAEVVACSEHILAMKDIPYSSTHYDELIKISNEIYNQSKKVTSTYGKPDLKLTGEVFVKGVDDTYSNAMSDWQDNDRSGYTVALNLSFPLGREKIKGIRAVKKEYEKIENKSFVNDINAKLYSAHMGIQKAIPFLFASIKAQEKENFYLNNQIKDSKRKYLQGRISATDLTNSQDNFLATELSIIDTKLTILSTLFDYFQFFPKTQCAFNGVML